MLIDITLHHNANRVDVYAAAGIPLSARRGDFDGAAADRLEYFKRTASHGFGRPTRAEVDSLEGCLNLDL
jgi:hypothetical protein